MARVAKTCSSCGNIFYYDDSLFAKKPELGDGFFDGYVCTNCANDRRERKRHEERMTFEKELIEKREWESNYENLSSNRHSSNSKIKFGLGLSFDSILTYSVLIFISSLFFRWAFSHFFLKQTATTLGIILTLAIALFLAIRAGIGDVISVILSIILISFILSFIQGVFHTSIISVYLALL